MKFSLEKEELFLISVMMPLVLSLGILLTSVKAPNELFSVQIKKTASKKIHKVAIKEDVKEEAPKPEVMPSLSQTLAPPASSLSGDLKSLSAGLVSEGNGGSGGMNITQGSSDTSQLVAGNEGQNRPARVLQVVNPVYPQSAQARGIEGFVILEILISERGQVSDAKVITAEPAGIFDQVAIEAVKKWQFEPGLHEGKTIASRIKQKVNFELN